MQNSDLLILSGGDVHSLLSGREIEVLDAVRKAYETHHRGESNLPHSTFLRFPENQNDRIIALPAYLGEEISVAGVKWISSFPANIEKGIDRASAVIILNSLDTGRPEAILEGAIISAKRTAASATLAAKYLHKGDMTNVGLIGCGLINFEIINFLSAIYKNFSKIIIFDIDEARAWHFKGKCEALIRGGRGIAIEITNDIERVLQGSQLISIATTASKPYITNLSSCQPASTILHISLRDLSQDVILSADNVVDDSDHVCRAQTSLHLAEAKACNRDFIRATLAEVMLNTAVEKKNGNDLTVFSPFGLGALDISVAKLVCNLGIEKGKGTLIRSFFPYPWNASNQSV